MKSILSILLFFTVCAIIIFNMDKPHKNQLSSDACGYYLYLPAFFIYNDISELKFYNACDSEYSHTLRVNYSLYQSGKKNNILDKYPIGVSFFELPLFLAANMYCYCSNQYKADGFSMPYQLAAIFSNIFWVIIGLFILRKVLKRYYNENVTTITLLCISFGTNLYAYNSFIIGMSHTYSFFLFASLLLITDIIYTKPLSNIKFILLGFVLGFIVIVRPVNILSIIICLFWKTNSISSIIERARFIIKNYIKILYSVLIFMSVLSIQLMYWKYITGHWVIYSYKDEKFDFLKPNIINGLFSFRKGWFIYTPMAFISFIGFYFLWQKKEKLILPFALFFILAIYVNFSWQQWWYGGSFGCRVFIESLAFLSLPLAAIIEHYSTSKMKKVIICNLLFFIIFHYFYKHFSNLSILYGADSLGQYDKRILLACFWQT